MSELMYKSSSIIFKLIENMVELNITTDGLDKIKKNTPYLFSVNHFTRMETFVLPFDIYKLTGLRVRSLADHSVFVGLLGSYMSEIGTVSTKDKNRDNIILSDLILNKSPWIIYPEGSMLKNKKITKDENGFLLHDKDKVKRIHSGASIYALKSELEKQNYLQFVKNDDKEKIDEFKNKYLFEENDEISYKNTQVIPVNISYTPIRGGQNSIKTLLDSVIDSKIESLDEEMEIEGSLLLNSQINISFGDSIDISEYIYTHNTSSVGTDEIIEHSKLDLTNKIMDKVYQGLLISFDHIFAITLECYPKDEIDLDEFRCSMYLISRSLLACDSFKLHPFLHERMFKLLNHEKLEQFDDIMNVAVDSKILEKVTTNTYKINRKNFENEYTFDSIRLKNILRVLVNELSILDYLIATVTNELNKPIKLQAEDSFYIIFRRDLTRYKTLYNKFYSVMESKSIDVGKPFIFYDEKFTKGIVISHGFMSTPKEVQDLANFFYKNEFNVYAVRLPGHGTHSDDLRDRTKEDWYDSVDKAYSAISLVSKEVYLCGFSTGGLLSLLLSTKKDYKIKALICINSAVSLHDIRIKYLVPTLSAFSSFISLFDMGYEYVESEPENPEINYKKSYMTSIHELGKLIEETHSILHKVRTPTLIIQSSNDPIVEPRSAEIIYHTISSDIKEKQLIESNKHVIITNNDKELVFEKISTFLKNLSQ